MEGVIKKDLRISKFNFGSRKFYLIKEAILEKRIIYKNSKSNKIPTTYVITDLAAYYDR